MAKDDVVAAPPVIKTGGQVDALVMALAETAGDKDNATRDTVRESLKEIGRRKAPLLLSSCQNFLCVHKKVPTAHRVVLLEAMCDVATERTEEISNELADGLIKLGVRELTASKEHVPGWQEVASKFLIALGGRFGTEVVQALLEKCEPGQVPSYFVLMTLGDFAAKHPFLIVPQLRDVFGRLLPTLAMITQANLKIIFSQAMGRFCDAILNYVVNIDQVKDKNITIKDFCGQAFSAYEIMVTVWLVKSTEAKARLSIVEALGPICHVLDRQTFESQLLTLLPNVIALYGKHKEDQYPITQGVSMILEAAVVDDSQAMYPMVDQVLNSLQPFVYARVDYSNPSSFKNHNEILRCFEIVTRVFSDRVIAFLITKLVENKDEKNRMGTLDVIKHLINANDKHLSDKKEMLLGGLKPLLESTNLKVNKCFATVIIAMASKGYLALEGGERMIEFIVKQCSLPEEDPKASEKKKDKPNDPEEVTSGQLRSMCDNVLHLITTTLPNMDAVLWPFLLEFLLSGEYSEAQAIVCRCIGYLGGKKRAENAPDYLVNFDTQVNIPKPVQIIARLIILASQPLQRKRGEHVLRALMALGPIIDADLPPMWDEVIPKMLKWLEDRQHEDPFDAKGWEDLLLKFLSKLFDLKNSEDFTFHLGEEFAKQLELYKHSPVFKNFSFRCLGVAIKKSTNKKFIRDYLDLMFASIDHKDQCEREGCAIGVGFIASAHTDTILEKLQNITRNDMVRKSTGFFGLAKDKSETDVDRIKATVMLCFGYTALYSPVNLLTSRLDVSVLNVIVPLFAAVRDPVVKENTIKGVDLICEALLPRRLKDNQFVCTRRQELLNQMLVFIGQEGKNLKSNVQAFAINACTTMVHLAPRLPETNRIELQQKAISCLCDLPATVDEKLLETLTASLTGLLAATMFEDLSVEHLHNLFNIFLPYVKSSLEHQRVRSLRVLLPMLRNFYQYAGTDKPSELNRGEHKGVGKLIALIVPRCTDSVLSIRQDSIDTVQVLLKIDLLVRGGTAEQAENDVAIKAMSVLRERSEKSESASQFAVVNDMSKVLAKKLALDELAEFLYSLLEGLIDLQPSSGAGACVMLNGLFKLRGKDLEAEIPKIIKAIHDKLALLQNEQTEIGTLRSVRTLAAHHLAKVTTELLNYPVPYDLATVKLWHTLAGDTNLAQPLLDQLLEILNRYQPFEEKPSETNKGTYQRFATLPVRQATAALAELFVPDETEELLGANLARVLGSAIVRIGSASHITAGDSPIDDAMRFFRQVIIRSESFFVNEDLEEAGETDHLKDGALYPNAVAVVARSLSNNIPDVVKSICDFMVPFLMVPYDSQRVVVCAFFSEVIQQGATGRMDLMEMLMNSLLGRLVDDSHDVRRWCIRGLGNVSSAPEDQLPKYSTTILSAMMAGMDDKNDIADEITLESMNGLSKIMSKLEENNIRPILINICLRIRPCFEKEQAAVRAAAITLFGRLSIFGNGPSRVPYLEQIHANFVSMLLHLNEESDEVKLACKQSLKAVGPLLNASQTNDLFQKALRDDRSLAYGEFVNDLAKCLIAEFPDKMNFYVMGCVGFFRSQWDPIKANASMFVGFILGNLPSAQRKVITTEHVCSALITLLKDPSALVRTKTSETIGLLYDY